MVSDSHFVTEGKCVRLPDGRALGYAEYGDLTGRPVLFFPGAPSSRLLHPPEEPTRALGVRLIVVERPGFGQYDQLAATGAEQIGGKFFARTAPLQNGFGTRIPEASDHRLPRLR